MDPIDPKPVLIPCRPLALPSTDPYLRQRRTLGLARATAAAAAACALAALVGWVGAAADYRWPWLTQHPGVFSLTVVAGTIALGLGCYRRAARRPPEPPPSFTGALPRL